MQYIPQFTQFLLLLCDSHSHLQHTKRASASLWSCHTTSCLPAWTFPPPTVSTHCTHTGPTLKLKRLINAASVLITTALFYLCDPDRVVWWNWQTVKKKKKYQIRVPSECEVLDSIDSDTSRVSWCWENNQRGAAPPPDWIHCRQHAFGIRECNKNTLGPFFSTMLMRTLNTGNTAWIFSTH